MFALRRTVKQCAKGEFSHVGPAASLARLPRVGPLTPENTNVRIAHCTLLLALLGAAAAHGADVYRTRAPDGTITYTDRPQNDNSEYVPVNTPRPANAPAAQSQPRPRTGGANAQNPQVEAPAAPPAPTTGPTTAQLREQRQKNCDIARERLERFTISRRLYRTNAAGDREYLSDQETAEARAKAQSDVQDWCG